MSTKHYHLPTIRLTFPRKLVDTEPSEPLTAFLDLHSVTRKHISIAANKDGAIKMTPASISQAVLFVSNPANHPVYIHCNQGKHRTGCVIACLRKCQGVPIEEILEEYKTYAYPKERPGDIAFIKSFDPQWLEEFATKEELNERFPGAYRVDSKTDMFEFAPGSLPSLGQFSSGESDVSEDNNLALMLAKPHTDAIAGGVPYWNGQGGHPMIRDFARQINGEEAEGSVTNGHVDEDDQRVLLELCEATTSKEGRAAMICPIRSRPVEEEVSS
jgi:hypothetical protein